jgi:hypothetical protein
MAAEWMKTRLGFFDCRKLKQGARQAMASPEFVNWAISMVNILAEVTGNERRVSAHVANRVENVSAHEEERVSAAFPFGAHVAETLASEFTEKLLAAGILRLWAKANEETPDGFLPGDDLTELDKIGDVPGLGRIMAAAGWAEEVEGEGVVLPDFLKWNTPRKKSKAPINGEDGALSPEARRLAKKVEYQRKYRQAQKDKLAKLEAQEADADQNVSAHVPNRVSAHESASSFENENTLTGIREERESGEGIPQTPSCPEPAEPASGPPASPAKSETPDLLQETPVPLAERISEPGQADHATQAQAAKAGKGELEPLELLTPDEGKVLLTFPVIGYTGKGGKKRRVLAWGLTDTTLDRFKDAYPTLDCLTEMRKALVWVQANPQRRKTPTGMEDFLVGWLNKAGRFGAGKSFGSDPGQQPPRRQETMEEKVARVAQARKERAACSV